MAKKGREADCDDVTLPSIPDAPGVGKMPHYKRGGAANGIGPLPHYSRGGKTKHVEEDGGSKGRRRLDRAQRCEGGRKSGGRLTYGEREKMPSSEFALPGKGSGPKGKGGGSYPIPDESHGRNALARVAQHGSPAEKAEVRRKVHAKFPDIGKE
jgi:hypothetical protein